MGAGAVFTSKPNLSLNLSPLYDLSHINSSFLSSLPQICSYARLFSRVFRVNNVLGITFNKEGVWLYDSNIIRQNLKDFLDKVNFPIEKRVREECLVNSIDIL